VRRSRGSPPAASCPRRPRRGRALGEVPCPRWTREAGEVHAAFRERFERLDQADLDAALEADREESVRAAEAMLPYAAALFAEAEW